MHWLDKSTNDYLHYIIFADPIPLKRARHGMRRVYDEQKEIKLIYGITLQRLHGDKKMLKGPLHVDIDFFFRIPDSRRKKDKPMLEETAHYFKPDTTNLFKFIEDLGSGLLYHDDCQISSITSQKIYSEQPRIEMIIREFKRRKLE